MREPTTDEQCYWADLLKTAEDSGMSLAEFAKTKDIPAQKLYQWRSTYMLMSARSGLVCRKRWANYTLDGLRQYLFALLDRQYLRRFVIPVFQVDKVHP